MTKVTMIHYEVPDDLHRRAKAAAAIQGVTLKEYVTAALDAAVERDESKRK